MTFAEILSSVQIPKIKKDSPLTGIITGDTKGVFITICKGKQFGTILQRIRDFKQMHRAGRYNGQTLAWEFPIAFLNQIRENFSDLDDRTGDLEIPDDVPEVKVPEKPKFAGKIELKPLFISISWHNLCTPAEFSSRLDACKKLKEKFGGRFDGHAKAWEINPKAAQAIRNNFIFKEFEFIGNFPEPQGETIPTDELTNKLKAEAERIVNEVLPNGRTLFDHQKSAVIWMVTRQDTKS
jgi:hypothetical protein